MTSQELFDNYLGIKAEIKQIESEIQKLKEEAWQYGTDGVSGCSDEIPYQKRSIIIGGYYRPESTKNKIIAQQKRLEQYKIKLLEQKNQVEDFLETVPSAIDRVILRGYYIEGKYWKEVAADLTENSGQDFSEGKVKMRAKRFFEKS